TGPVDRGMHRCSGFPFAQVATGNLDVAVIGQLPTADFPFGDGSDEDGRLRGTVPALVPLAEEFGKRVGKRVPHRHIRRHLCRTRRLTAGRSTEHRAETERTWASRKVLLTFSPACHG